MTTPTTGAARTAYDFAIGFTVGATRSQTLILTMLNSMVAAAESGVRIVVGESIYHTARMFGASEETLQAMIQFGKDVDNFDAEMQAFLSNPTHIGVREALTHVLNSAKADLNNVGRL